MWWHPDQFEKRKPNLKVRADIIRGVRSYFDAEGFTEVQTPALQVMPSADTHIHAFILEGKGLHTSAEIAMKKLLVAGAGDIYQICPVYRKGEDTPLHSPEFTMLEWYRVGADYHAMMEDCENLLESLGFQTPCERLSVAEAFKTYAGVDLNEDLKPAAEKLGIRTTDTDTFEDIFHAIMAEKIEPNLGQGTPTILYDYPASMAALAKKKGDVAERFELYINGVEIANAYSELTDAQEQRARLKEDLKRKEELYGQKIPVDEDFIRALEYHGEYGMPECAGCALGLDRLVMLACDAHTIEDVLWAGKP